MRAVVSTCKPRIKEIPQGKVYWRAQRGNDWREVNSATIPTAYPPSRMKPLPEGAIEGRANPKGIPFLYVSTTANAAMSEQRPWVGSMVSLARFEVLRPLRVVDCSLWHDQYFTIALQAGAYFGPQVQPEAFDALAWAAIDRSFAQPVTASDNSADYAATQIIAELFRHEGYDGVVYKSAFGDDAFSLAFFDINCAAQLDGMIYNTEAVNFVFKECGDPYFVPPQQRNPAQT